MTAFNNDDAKWQAVATRNTDAAGHFYYAVKTTGVYCRPDCPGRPLRKNVVFFEDTAAAVRAGFRACKRCKPDQVRPSRTMSRTA